MVDGLDALSIIKGSMCMACGESGDTRMMTTKIPFFREIIVCSFECDACGDTNNEVTFGGEIQEKGVRFVLDVRGDADLSRTCIKVHNDSSHFHHLACARGEYPSVESGKGGPFVSSQTPSEGSTGQKWNLCMEP
jgi:hypothetical protein